MRSSRKNLIVLTYVLPAVLFMGVFVYYPLVQNFIYSFYRWSAFSPSKDFVALENYRRLFQDPVFYTAIGNNLLYAVLSVICQCGLGLILAKGIIERFDGRMSIASTVGAGTSVSVDLKEA